MGRSSVIRALCVTGFVVALALLPAHLSGSGAAPELELEPEPKVVTPLAEVKPPAAGDAVSVPSPRRKADPKECVTRKRVAEARRWASDRAGEVSFAVLDECKRLVGDHRYRVHYSASVVKVMLLVAYLRRPEVSDRALSDSERDMLGPMITVSDNDRASQVYAIVGAEGLYEVADKANMHVFSTTPVWGGSEISAGDQAGFVGRLEHYVPKRHEDYALGLMADVTAAQRWGIPRLDLPRWEVHLKGGWAPQASGGGWRVNQVALLRRGDRRLSLAILTSDDPDFAYGQATVVGVARRLLRAYRR